ncbi:ShlB/FhaC/HecB family hemolysin secretion/activation protein [Luteibacter sp. SG786]|uniref:ShlB/FhaC/HecB family hemolysin secretion/activation protein n=1 Tax=Luteibacter sp. SG786 TaxID=2587130 RepID=UPI00142278F4|nr:ShlB/FhaC/HecB family hemolysin secretion/activation protein [Luteibacter sp. SG786]NII53233.1 hemolysin activation/secretion protein [Luteibacter sp. SG786]
MRVTGESRWRTTAHGLFSLLAIGAGGTALAQQTTLDKQEQLRRAQQLEQRETERKEAPFQPTPPTQVERADAPLPKEAICFPLQSLKLEGDRLADFAWAQRYLDHFVGQCVGRDGLEALQRRLSNLVIARGFVTTRVGVPAQDISKGHLRMLLVPGTLRHIRFAPGSPELNWLTAFPIREGDLLNLHAIEQGLEQLKRVPSQDVTMDIAPGEKVGESDVVLTVHTSRRWHVVVDASDSGLKGTGKNQGNLNVSYDNPLGLNDLFSIGAGHALFTHADGGSTFSENATYSIPWGWWTFSGSISTYRYRQWIEGFETRFRSTGISTSSDITAQRMLTRGTSSKTSLEMRLAARSAHSYIQGVEVGIQRQRVASAELALVHRHYFGQAQLDARLGYQRGTPWFGSQWIGYDPEVGFPTNRYGLTTLDLSLSKPLNLGSRQAIWDSSLRLQRSTDHLPAAELITIGGRYSVRGFDGEQTLAGERGAYLRNTFTLPMGALAPYLGVDIGRVAGPSTVEGHRQLTGAVIGLRGSYAGLSWDLFAGRRIHAPRGFDTERPTTGFQLIYQY